jgi:hypothetical protein
MPKYLFGGHIYSPEHENWPRILQKGQLGKLRPVCLCFVQCDGRSLYIALARGQHLLRRLSYSGPLHGATPTGAATVLAVKPFADSEDAFGASRLGHGLVQAPAALRVALAHRPANEDAFTGPSGKINDTSYTQI